MQIQVVRQGDTIYDIAKTYGISPERIISANQLEDPNDLVVGQALVIPITGSFYWVEEGDSLYTIGEQFGISPQRLATVNKIPVNKQLLVGTRLYIPPNKRDGEFNAYMEPRGTSVSETLTQASREAAPYLTYLSPFSYTATRDGSLNAPLLDDFPTIAEENNNILVMVVTNQENQAFSSELGRILLNDMDVQDRLLSNIEDIAQTTGFRDIHFDFEALRPNDRDAYTAFLQKAKDRFAPLGWQVSIALAPKTSASQQGIWYEAHDYKAQGAIVDWVLIMTYEWGYSGGPAQAVSPIGPVREVLTYAVSEIPAEKVMMGQNLYGYDWTLPFKKGTTAKAVSPQQAIALARRYETIIKYDYTAQAPFFNYKDNNGREHEVWFEDARSIQAKFDLVKELGLLGVSYWKLGLSFPQNWLLLQSNFNIVKK
ncbi:MAG: LysM peptidoglycan-binding domain-containing protein [Bacillus sp. (in: firmicutes)]